MCCLACLLTAHDLLRRFQASVCAKQHTVAHCAGGAGTLALTVQAWKEGLVTALGSALLCTVWSISIYY